MKKNTLSIVFFVFCVIALAIAIFQITDERIWDGGLSLVYSLVFLFGGLANRKLKE